MAQLVTRIDNALLSEIDRLVERQQVASRSDAVRRALEAYVDRLKRDLVGEEIVAGYARIPPTDELWTEDNSASMIAEEPW